MFFTRPVSPGGRRPYRSPPRPPPSFLAPHPSPILLFHQVSGSQGPAKNLLKSNVIYFKHEGAEKAAATLRERADLLRSGEGMQSRSRFGLRGEVRGWM